MTSQNSICRLCCDHIEEKNILIINNSTQVMLQTLLINIDIAANEHSVICETCHRKLENNYCFKKKCLFTEDTLRPFVVENVKINLSEIRNEVIKAGCVEMEKNVCRLCLEYCDDDMLLNEDENQQFCNFFPEINLNLTHFVVLCLTCYNALQKYFMFVMSCSQSEGSLSRYPADNNSKEDYDINSENCQIAVKSEDVKKVELLDDGIEIKHEGDSYDLLEENWYTTNFVDCAQINDIKSENIQLDNEEDDKRLILNQELDIKCDADSSDEKCLYSDPDGENTNKSPSNGVEIDKQRFRFKGGEGSDSEKTYTILTTHTDLSKIKIYQCGECNYKNRQKGNLKTHILSKHIDLSKIQMYKCDKCDYESKWRGQIKRHISEMHTDPSEIQVYQCGKCIYQSNRKRNLHRHILERHTDPSKIQIHACKDCSYKCKQKSSLNRHILDSHTDPSKIQMHKCENCDYKSKQKGQLKNHILAKHTDLSNIQMFKCDKCHYESKWQGQIKTHIFEKHTDPSKTQVYQCEKCVYKSNRKGNLKRHILETHADPSKIQMHKCEKCDYKNKQKDCLRKHIIAKHTDPSKLQVYKCEKCDYKSKRKWDLKKHILARHNVASKT